MTVAAMRDPKPRMKQIEPSASITSAAARRTGMSGKCLEDMCSTLPAHPKDLLMALVQKITLRNRRPIKGINPCVRNVYSRMLFGAEGAQGIYFGGAAGWEIAGG